MAKNNSGEIGFGADINSANESAKTNVPMDQESSNRPKTFNSISELDSKAILLRHCDDLVGRRVLCIPQTFEVAVPSPAQISSALWSSKTLDVLDQLSSNSSPSALTTSNSSTSPCQDNTPSNRRVLSWCPIHHHHQNSQQEYLDAIEGHADGQKSMLKESLDNCSKNRINSTRFRQNLAASTTIQQSYSMIKSLYQKNSGNLSSPELSDKPDKALEDSNIFCNQNQTNTSHSRCELCNITTAKSGYNKEESFKRYLSSLPWRLGTIRAVNHRDLKDESLSIMIEFDLLSWKSRDWYQVHSKPVDHDENFEEERSSVKIRSPMQASQKRSRKHCDTSDDSRKSKSSKLDHHKLPSQSNKTIELESKKLNLEAGIRLSMEAAPENIFNKAGDLDDTELSPSAFSVLLVESSMCCLNRKNSPIGKDKLWPALVFKPLIDTLGLFDSVTIKAIEYFDPKIKNDGSKMKSNCDIRTILDDLKTEMFGNSDSNEISETKKTNTTTLIFTDDPSDSQDPQIPTEDEINHDCSCWSPKVEFVADSMLHQLCDDDLRRNGGDRDEQSSRIKAESSTAKVPETAVNVTQVTSNLGSFKSFLRFFQRIIMNRLQSDSTHLQSIEGTRNQSKAMRVKLDNSKSGKDNDLLQAIMRFPNLYHNLMDWHLYQDAQSILGSTYTAPLLVGNRVKVYRSIGTTQWYTAVIISHDERTNLLTLIDDTVLEEHHEDPLLLEMHLIDESSIRSIIEGDVSTLSQGARRRGQRSNQRQAAQTAQLAIMNSSMASMSNGGTSCVAGQSHSGSSAHSRQPSRSQGLLQPSQSPSPSPSAASSSSSSAFSGHLLSTEINQTRHKALSSISNSSIGKNSSARPSNNKDAGGKRVGSNKHNAKRNTESFFINDTGSPSNNMDESMWANSRSIFEVSHKLIDEVSVIGANNPKNRCLKLEHGQTKKDRSVEELDQIEDKSKFLSPFLTDNNSPLLPTATSSSSLMKFGQSRVEASLDGTSFLSHRLRLEALERKPSPVEPNLEGSTSIPLGNSTINVRTNPDELLKVSFKDSQNLLAYNFTEVDKVLEAGASNASESKWTEADGPTTSD